MEQENSNDISVKNRLERYQAFDKFHTKAECIFKGLRDSDKYALEYQKFYILSVCSGGRLGGDRKDMIEVFWGD